MTFDGKSVAASAAADGVFAFERLPVLALFFVQEADSAAEGTGLPEGVKDGTPDELRFVGQFFQSGQQFFFGFERNHRIFFIFPHSDKILVVQCGTVIQSNIFSRPILKKHCEFFVWSAKKSLSRTEDRGREEIHEGSIPADQFLKSYFSP